MKKLLILLVLVFSVFNTAFAGHTPNREELNEVQQTFSGFYFDMKGKKIVNYLKINDSGLIEFKHNGVLHLIRNPELEVDYNDGLSISFNGNCSKEGCDFQGWNISMSPLGYDRFSHGYSYSLVLLRFKENVDATQVTDPSELFDRESYVIVKK